MRRERPSSKLKVAALAGTGPFLVWPTEDCHGILGCTARCPQVYVRASTVLTLIQTNISCSPARHLHLFGRKLILVKTTPRRVGEGEWPRSVDYSGDVPGPRRHGIAPLPQPLSCRSLAVAVMQCQTLLGCVQEATERNEYCCERNHDRFCMFHKRVNS